MDPQPSRPDRRFILRISDAIDNYMRAAFFRLGLFVARRPAKVIIASLIFLFITAAGMLRFRTDSREDKLWVPTGTTAILNRRWVDSNFGRFSRFSSIAFVATDPAKGIATRDAFLDILYIAEKAFNETAGPLDEEGPFNTTITWEERCITTSDANANRMCTTLSAFNVFYKVENIVRRQDRKVNFFATVRKGIEQLSDDEIEATLKEPPQTFDNSSFIPAELYTTGDDSDKIQVFLFGQIIENNEIEKDGSAVDEEAEELEKVWTDYILNTTNFNDVANVRWYASSPYGQGQSLSEALYGDLPLLSFGFVLLGIYIVFFLGDWHAIRSHRLLGLAALVTCGLALGTCFGLSSALGMFFGPVHQILPLLIIGIGADDCFHITRAADGMFQRVDLKDRSLETRIALAMSQAGTAITVTSFTNVAVFLLSAISRLPALRYFALWAAIGILFAWVYAITFFTAVVVYDFRRIEANRLDCVPCFKPREKAKELNWFKQEPGAFNRFFSQRFGPFITGNIARIVILVLFTAGLGASIYGCSQLYLKFRFAFFYPSGSSQREYQDVIDEYFELGDSTSVYIRNKPLKTVENQERFLRLCHPETGLIVENEWIQNNSINCWYYFMRMDIPPTPSDGYYEPDEFISIVKSYISSNSSGNRFVNDIVFNDDETEIIGTRFRAKYVYRETNSDEVTALDSVRRVANFEVEGVAEESEGFGTDENGKFPAAFPYVFQDTFTEQYAALPTEIGASLGLASVAVAIVCFILVGHPLVALISVVVVGMVIIGVLGLTYFTGINLNSVSVITLVLCTGIAVDFVVHITRAFLEHVGTRRERTIKALAQMGPPVFYAGFSTFLAIVVLAGAKSYIFQVLFFGFFFLIILAFLHGLVLGPVILSLIGPSSFFDTEEQKETAEKELETRFVEAAIPESKLADDTKAEQVEAKV